VKRFKHSHRKSARLAEFELMREQAEAEARLASQLAMNDQAGMNAIDKFFDKATPSLDHAGKVISEQHSPLAIAQLKEGAVK
jgi:hypothetical protein